MVQSPSSWVSNQIEKTAASIIQKYIPYSTGAQSLYIEEPEPPYQREFDPRWIYNIRQNHSLINNAIEEKVSQTFRRGFDEWEKEYEAKCPECREEFPDETPFRQQYESIPEDEDIDFDSERICPECEEMVQMKEPDPKAKHRAEKFFGMANERNMANERLQPTEEAGVGQTLLSVFKEVAWDIQSFDDGWIIFDRSYRLDRDGNIVGYELEGVYRGPPDLMRYSIDEETGKFGGEYWACPKCRTTEDRYEPETTHQPCSHCGGATYEVLAYATDNPGDEQPREFYIRGEFAHASEYEPSRYYGYSPVVTLFDEARALEKMDEWYREAYEQRRAPRGALVIRSSNAEATRKWNRGQLEKLNSDSQHIPTLMDDTEGAGDPIKFEHLLESPAEMQQMEMREWIKERISGKYGVTSIMMSGSPDNSGLSQSMEVQVSNRSADRLRKLFNNVFVPAVLGQVGTEGWCRQVAEVEEEDEMAEAERKQRELQIAQQAAQLGLEVEWTDDGNAIVKAGPVEMPDEEEGGLGGMLGGDGEGPEEPGESAFGDAEGQPQLEGVEAEGGAPSQESRPQDDNPVFGRMAKDLVRHEEIEVFNEWSGEWEKAELVDKVGDNVVAETESGVKFTISETGEVAPA